MRTSRRNLIALSDMQILILLAVGKLILHVLTNNQYGFHRDELDSLDNARYLAWGYVAYPPLSPLIGRIALELFGSSLVGFRFFAAVAQSIAMVLTGLMARELGGKRPAQVVAALAVAVAPVSIAMGAMFQYVSFDLLWWVLIAYLTIRLLKSEDARWWLAVGAVIGLGMMTKYTIAVFVVGIVAGVVLTSARRYLKSPWLWAGVGLSLLVFLPNLIWQAQHDFISLTFLSSIHARDVAIGRTSDFLPMQLIVSANPFTLPLWLAGLYFYFFAQAGARYRPLGWMYLIPLLLFLVMQGRSYYLAPAYPMLIAAGTVFVVDWLSRLSPGLARVGWGVVSVGLVAGAALGGALMLPVAPINSDLWNLTSEVHDSFREQVGWPELVATVADIYAGLPDEERGRTGILTGNYGEAGAINLYGPAYALPQAISGVNSYWLRGYGDPPPEVVIVLGFNIESAQRFFTDCDVAGRVSNPYDVKNEESLYHPYVMICREPRQPWPELWADLQSFG